MNDTSLQADTLYREEAPTNHVAEPRSVAAPRPYLPSDPRRKSLFITGLLSFMPGLGHIYLGYYQRGFIHFVIFGSTISLVSSGQIDGLGPLLEIFIPFFWLFNQIDAHRRATLINLTLEGIENMPLPDEMQGPLLGGSTVAGTALLAGGVIALSNTLFNLPLDWLNDWWPIAPIALGAYLIYRARQDQQS
ncbi:MAG: DUF5668 domain-containing protein [Gammaproteobacteria bacterium]|nr:DUF5668 domain-containing protein [Gammaproteobacteria bacterium]